MKVISLLQPWASLAVLGHKKVETRSRNIRHRGPLLIHASRGKSLDNSGCCIDFLQEFNLWGMLNYKDLPFGAIIGMVNVIETFSTSLILKDVQDVQNEVIDGCLHIGHKETVFGDYSEGRYGYIMGDPVRFKEPIPAKGMLGLWECPQNLMCLVEGQISNR